MNVLVTGANGQLGHDVVRTLRAAGAGCVGASRKDFDITDEHATRAFINACRPDAVVHCAAYTAVDRAQEEPDICYKTNVLGTGYIAAACADIGAKLAYISTDYVFDGSKEKPYETDDAPHPINHYGWTKYLGERAVQERMEQYFIIRISWVFGAHGSNFVKTMLNLAKQKQEIRVVSDQVGSPTYAVDAARLIADMLQTDKYGIYHATNEGFCSRYEFAREIFRAANRDIGIIPVASRDYPAKAERPKNSRLSKKKLDEAGFDRLPGYPSAVERFIHQHADVL